MTCSRRDFLKEAAGATAASAVPLGTFVFLSTDEARAAVANSKVRYAFLIDTNKQHTQLFHHLTSLIT